MSNIFEKEIAKTIENINAVRCPGDLCFVMVSDTKLTDTARRIISNIQAVDRQVHFDFMVHLGDLLCGGSPRKVSCRILSEELAAYRSAIATQKLFVAQGETDGWRDESFCGQLVMNIMTDPIWHEETSFIDQYEHVKRSGNAPYYYVDDPVSHTRCIFLASERYEMEEEHKLYQQYHTLGLKQLVWLEEALKLQVGWNVLIFSHAIPGSRFETGVNPPSYKGNAIDKPLAILQKAVRDHGIRFVAWICGHYGYDCEIQELSMNHIALGGLSAFPCPGVELPEARRETKRMAGTEKEDLWDALVLKPQERKLYIFRFGAGSDRAVDY